MKIHECTNLALASMKSAYELSGEKYPQEFAKIMQAILDIDKKIQDNGGFISVQDWRKENEK
ncbi:MAG: hypothetical protein J6D29_04575 [Solobacterium sp.]|nr:hypothetical protein [Solobacterium sp.]